MARQARYEDFVTYDPDPVEEPQDDLRDPNSGRLWSELAAEARARRVVREERRAA